MSFNSFKNNFLKESLGDGIETFTQKLEMHGPINNLEINGCPKEWGEEIDEARGQLTYSIEFEMDSSGISSINANIERIDLNLEILTGWDEEDSPIIESREYSITKDQIQDSPQEVNVYSFPLYLDLLEIDFTQARENPDSSGLEGVVFRIDIGSKDLD